MARRKKGLDINGWLIIDKSRNMGSTEVVSQTRRFLNANKNGHCGTLDPFATGVLPIAFGEATKLIPFVTDGNKEYEFIIEWGVETDTDDSEGAVVSTNEKIPTSDEIIKIIPEFIGKIVQTPPVYSAIRIDGKHAYELARKGKEVEMPSREIEIYDLEYLGDIDDNKSRFRVECSKGTYVRTLGKDMAIKLGTVGFLRELRRLKCGIFSEADAILLDNLKKMEYGSNPEGVLLPIDACLRDIAVIAVSEADAAKLKLGQGVSPKSYEALEGTAVAVFDNKLVAIVQVDERRISPVRVFNI